MGKAWIIASGKGGVGKSTIAACLAIGLTRLHQTVCIVDADVGLRDQDAILGLESRVVYDLVDVMNKECTLRQALVVHAAYPGLSLLPASQFARAKSVDPKAFRRIIEKLKASFDHVLIDCPAGIERGLRGVLNTLAEETVVVCMPDDVCIRDAERACTLLDTMHLPRPWLIVNRLVPELVEAGEMYSAQVVAQTLDLTLLGEIPEDPIVYRALLKHISPMNTVCEGQKAMTRIARRMAGFTETLPAYGQKKRSLLGRVFRRRVKEVKII